jgi:hypothetical protein
MAGYLIDILKCHSPNSIVAYFFCRSNQAGLTKACDIIRTLAYQFFASDPDARGMLETLGTEGFVVDDNLGVSFLFEKLLFGPLCTTHKDVFVIMDGLDEADLTTPDDSDRSKMAEMSTLLRCLAKLPSTRLLFLSRPIANVAAIIRATVKPIGMVENSDDINTYVTNTLAESQKLPKFFEDERVDPIQYFQGKANGIFLWVVLVLQRLEN